MTDAAIFRLDFLPEGGADCGQALFELDIWSLDQYIIPKIFRHEVLGLLLSRHRDNALPWPASGFPPAHAFQGRVSPQPRVPARLMIDTFRHATAMPGCLLFRHLARGIACCVRWGLRRHPVPALCRGLLRVLQTAWVFTQ